MAHLVTDAPRRLAGATRHDALRQIEARLAEAVSTFELEDLAALGGILEATRLRLLSRMSRPEAHVTADSDRFLTVQQVAERTGFSPDYVYRHRSELPFFRKVGRNVRASERDFNRWLRTRRPP